MAVDIRLGSGAPEVGRVHPLFAARTWEFAGFEDRQYAPSADGQRFLVVMPVPEPAANTITVVLDWTTGLRP
jgi:hypothetical protein